MGLDGYRDGLNAIETLKKIKANNYNYIDFSNYSPCYKFSNENLSTYYPFFNMNNGKVLTVCGSGDQVISSLLYGADKIDCFDSNILSYYTLMLKLYSIKYLEYSDFLVFFDLNKYSVDKKIVFDVFKNNIDSECVKSFWNLLFSSGIDIKYLYRDSDVFQNLLRCIPFLKVENYYKLKNNIDFSKINFVLTDIYDIFNCFNGKYNFINFSNICDYFDNLFPFYSLVNECVQNHLDSNGGMLVNYSWTRPYYNETNTIIAEMVGGYQKGIEASCYNDLDSIIYIKKTH